MKREKLDRLLALALHESTPIEEARTAALIALRELDALSLFTVSRASDTQGVRTERVKSRAVAAKYDSKCGECRRRVRMGDTIHWVQGLPIRCVVCGSFEVDA